MFTQLNLPLPRPELRRQLTLDVYGLLLRELRADVEACWGLLWLHCRQLDDELEAEIKLKWVTPAGDDVLEPRWQAQTERDLLQLLYRYGVLPLLAQQGTGTWVVELGWQRDEAELREALAGAESYCRTQLLGQ